jgi:hypothetical protein
MLKHDLNDTLYVQCTAYFVYKWINDKNIVSEKIEALKSIDKIVQQKIVMCSLDDPYDIIFMVYFLLNMCIYAHFFDGMFSEMVCKKILETGVTSTETFRV